MTIGKHQILVLTCTLTIIMTVFCLDRYETLEHVIVKSILDSLDSRYNSEVHRSQWDFIQRVKSVRASQGYTRHKHKTVT